MEKEQRTRLQKATQDARRLLEEEFRSQLLQTYDIDVDKVRWADEPGAHLLAEQRLIREKLIASIEHKEAQINDRKEALLLALREMAFTALNRFVALKLMEARELVRPCVSGGLESAGFLEFTAVAQGLLADQESSYRLYLETIFEDVSRELRALFDPRDPASLLWPKRAAMLELLDILNRPELGELWREDETLGWVYQYFNADAERKKMREESAAPRNSRELAVRNQFFTPRYVVEFLTDNTLGRIWYEMRQGNTILKDRCRYLVRRPNEIWLQPGEVPPAQPDAEEALSQEELLRQPVHIPYRELKDPRDFRMLDPACGSMHFGLYAFDLYLEIYAEAWEIAQGPDEQVKRTEAFASFADYVVAFASKALFLREVPKLILQYNIHGIDIDPRATQIARLTLWLRAQRAWLEQGLEAAHRPPITRSNVVCAEPMPGERELLADFVYQQFPEDERGLVQQLLWTIFDKMQLAGEAGSLLKIEEEIRDAVDRARREWQYLAVRQQDLFSPAELAALGHAGSSIEADLKNLTKDVWIDIEDRIYSALRDYANQAEDNGYQRRLFAEDAAQGFAFIDACRKRYDVALMNPPFGDNTETSGIYLDKSFGALSKNLLCSFLSRCTSFCEDGVIGAITDNTWLKKADYEDLRGLLLSPASAIQVMIDLGWGVLDGANVATCCFAMNARSEYSKPAIAIKATEYSLDDKENAILRSMASLQSDTCAVSESIFIRDLAFFANFPGRAIAYETDSALVPLFSQWKPVDPAYASTRRGYTPGNSFRFFRCWWEVPIEERGFKWWPLNNGGSFAPIVGDGFMVALHESNWKSYRPLSGFRLESEQWFGKEGLAWGKRTDFMYAYPLPAGAMFSNEGHAAFPIEKSHTWPLIAFLNSETGQTLLNLYCGQHKLAGYVAQLPAPDLDTAPLQTAGMVAEEIYTRVAVFRSRIETSEHFATTVRHGDTPNTLTLEYEQLVEWYRNSLLNIDSIISDSVCKASSINSITRSLTARPKTSLAKEIPSNGWLEEIISFSLGCAYGRWDIRKALDNQVLPASHNPFAVLSNCPPGQLQTAHGLPARPEDVPATYPIRIAWDGILVDDSNHPLDIERCVREVIERIWSDKDGTPPMEVLPRQAWEIFDVKSLREYFGRPTSFFAHHLKRYSKSRRQAPIYWLLSVGSGSYSTWLYYHRFTQDTLYRVLRDFVEPRIQQAEREQFKLESQGALSGDAAALLQEAQTLLQDLRILKSELDLVAPLWNPNLNDGVIMNHAILWRITPYTPWQKKCKECWDKLVKGDYDWAHLAFHLWPERVILNCTTDRSLAIAHGLEERLWQETNSGNWLPRQLSEADLQALIAEHSNPAVKSALERFLAAPPPVAPTRTRASRSTRPTGSSAPRRPRGTAAVVDAEATRQVLLALTAAPSDGLAKAAIADLIGVEANALTAVIKQLKESGQIDQLGERRGARYVLSEQGRARLDQEDAT